MRKLSEAERGERKELFWRLCIDLGGWLRIDQIDSKSKKEKQKKRQRKERWNTLTFLPLCHPRLAPLEWSPSPWGTRSYRDWASHSSCWGRRRASSQGRAEGWGFGSGTPDSRHTLGRSFRAVTLVLALLKGNLSVNGITLIKEVNERSWGQ